MNVIALYLRADVFSPTDFFSTTKLVFVIVSIPLVLSVLALINGRLHFKLITQI